MNKLYLFLSIILLINFCLSCKNTQSNAEILKSAEKIIDTNPDSASLILSEIIDIQELTDREKADYGYLTALAHSRSDKAISEDNMILNSLEYYKRHHITDKLAETYMLAIYHSNWVDNQQMASEIINEALSFYLSENDSTHIADFYFMLADTYMGENHQEAIHGFMESTKYKENASAYYLIGMSYAHIGNLDSVSHYMHKAIDLSIKKNSIDDTSHYRRNYADILVAHKRYMEALSELKQVTKDTQNQQANTSIAQIYLALQQPDSAQIYINQAREVLKDKPSLTGQNFVNTLQAIVDYSKGHKIEWHVIGRYNDSYAAEVDNNKLILEEKNAIRNKLEQQNLQLTIDKQRNQLYITWGLVLLAFLTFFIAIYIRRKRSRLMEMEERQEVLEKLLKEANTTNAEDDNFFKKVLLQQLGLIRLVASTPTNQNQELLKQVSFINNKDIPAEDMLVWEDLYKLIDSIYNNFYTKLISTYGTILTEKEIQLCCLLCAGFSTKEISVVSQQSTQTIYQRKTTIRQKLSMDEKENIVDFIQN